MHQQARDQYQSASIRRPDSAILEPNFFSFDDLRSMSMSIRLMLFGLRSSGLSHGCHFLRARSETMDRDLRTEPSDRSFYTKKSQNTRFPNRASLIARLHEQEKSLPTQTKLFPFILTSLHPPSPLPSTRLPRSLHGNLIPSRSPNSPKYSPNTSPHPP